MVFNKTLQHEEALEFRSKKKSKRAISILLNYNEFCV